jgi:hypothetical protein
MPCPLGTPKEQRTVAALLRNPPLGYKYELAPGPNPKRPKKPIHICVETMRKTVAAWAGTADNWPLPHDGRQLVLVIQQWAPAPEGMDILNGCAQIRRGNVL